MKKTFTILFFIMVSFTVRAQITDNSLPEYNKATKVSRKLASKLQLNEHGYLRIKTLTADYLANRKKITESYAYNPELQKLKLAEASMVYERHLKLTLRARELNNYLSANKQPQGNYFSSLPE